MIRRRHGRSLRGNAAPSEDVNPNAYITNIADCMLVLVLGLLVALISYYQIDLQRQEKEDDIIGIEVNMDANSDGVIDDNYEQAGSVYYDSETGQYYLVQSE